MKFPMVFGEDEKAFSVSFEEKNDSVEDLGFGEIQFVTEYVGGAPYEGDYTVTPAVNAQTLPTKEKVMLDDLSIKAIPYFETSNNSGGNTVYIGNEV